MHSFWPPLLATACPVAMMSHRTTAPASTAGTARPRRGRDPDPEEVPRGGHGRGGRPAHPPVAGMGPRAVLAPLTRDRRRDPGRGRTSGGGTYEPPGRGGPAGLADVKPGRRPAVAVGRHERSGRREDGAAPGRDPGAGLVLASPRPRSIGAAPGLRGGRGEDRAPAPRARARLGVQVRVRLLHRPHPGPGLPIAHGRPAAVPGPHRRPRISGPPQRVVRDRPGLRGLPGALLERAVPGPDAADPGVDAHLRGAGRSRLRVR